MHFGKLSKLTIQIILMKNDQNRRFGICLIIRMRFEIKYIGLYAVQSSQALIDAIFYPHELKTFHFEENQMNNKP